MLLQYGHGIYQIDKNAQFDYKIFSKVEMIEEEINQIKVVSLHGEHEIMFFIFIVLLNGLKQILLVHMIIINGNYKN